MESIENSIAKPQGKLPSLLGFVSVVACLYLGRDFLLPLVLAALLSFMLAPACEYLERRNLGRILSVSLVSLGAFAVAGALMWLVATQLVDFARDLPKYKDNLVAKITAIRDNSGGVFGEAAKAVTDIADALKAHKGANGKSPGGAPAPATAEDGKTPPLPVVVQNEDNVTAFLRGILIPMLSPIGTAAMIALFVIFMLMGREDLRDRLIHLVGRGHLRVTTDALDEAGTRVSRYLLAQLTVNVLYGVPVAVALYFIGVPNAALWGVLATLLRFLPYVGPWLASTFPLFLSFAVAPGWTQFLLTAGTFVIMELVSNNIVEPLLYGASTGISPLAVIISAFFWAWLWGGVGLVLATPLTVCVAVAGKHVPGLSYLDVLLGEKPPITRAERLYQRILALDEEETCFIAESSVKEKGFAAAADEVFLPALNTLESDARSGLLSEKSRAAAHELLREVCAEIAETPPPPGQPVLCLPAMNEPDELAALLLCQALRSRGVPATVPSSKLLISESLDLAAGMQPPAICIVSFPPVSTLLAANLVQRLKEKLPSTFVTTLLWDSTESDFEKRRNRVKRRGAYDCFHSISSAMPTLSQLSGCKVDEPAEVPA